MFHYLPIMDNLMSSPIFKENDIMIRNQSNNNSRQPRRPLEQWEKDMAERLKKAWNDRKKQYDLTQTIAAKRLNCSQPTFSQYLQGTIPLNLSTLLAICSLIDVDPRKISSELTTNLPKKHGDNDELVQKILTLSSANRALVTPLVDALLSQQWKASKCSK